MTIGQPAATVLTMGTFDLFHAGHVFLLEQCRKLAGPGGQVVVAVNKDDFAARFKPRPIHTLHERTRILSACRYVDKVIVNDADEDASVTIMAVMPTFLVIGQDWAAKDYYAQLGIDQTWLDDANISLLYVPRPAGTSSSTDVRARVRSAPATVGPLRPDPTPTISAADDLLDRGLGSRHEPGCEVLRVGGGPCTCTRTAAP